MKDIIIDFSSFLKKPTYTIATDTFKQKVSVFFVMVILMVFTAFAVALFGRLVIMIINSDLGNKIYASRETNLFSEKYWENIFYIIALGPILEELIFRLSLNFKKINIAVALFLAIFILVGGNLSSISFYNHATYLKFGTLIGAMTLLYFIKQSVIYKIRTSYYPFLFYGIVVLFGLLHIGNFSDVLPLNYLWLMPLLVLPQLVSGLFIGYIRIKNGFVWGVFMHSLINSPVVLLYIINH